MAKFAKIIQKNNENFLIKKFIILFRRKIADSGKGRFSFVLTGGNSPIRLYKHLAKDKKIPWKKIDFFIGDERYVKEKLSLPQLELMIFLAISFRQQKLKVETNLLFLKP